LVYCAVFLAAGAELYVAPPPTGNDAAAGTITAPLATLAAARDKADQLKANNTPVTVYLRGGTYYLDTTVTFGPTNSGSATAPIVYAAYGSEKPVISGGIKVTSAWTASPANANIMVTTVAQNLKVDQLFLNGKRQVLARYPNFSATTVILDGYAADCIDASRVSRWANPAEGPGYIRALNSAQWGGESYIITAKNASNNTLTTKWVGDNNRGSSLDATHRMVENIFEELDAAGEWFYRKSTGQLFFWPPAGTNLSTSIIELASQDELVRFIGTSNATASSVKYIQFNGITFTHAYRTLFSQPYETVLQSDWAIARAGAIFLQNAENIVIKNCLFDQVGGNGIFASGYNRNHVFSNNVFNDAGASCIALMGLTGSVRCPSSYTSTPTCTDKTPGPVDPVNGEFPAYVKIDNTMMSHLGRFEKQPAGIALSATECDTLRHNTIHDCPRAGICICDGCWGGHVIEYNWVYNDVLETGDHGPINAWGRDRNGRWQNDTSATQLDAWKTTIIRNNRFEAPYGDFGIDLDDQASNYVQYNNLLIGGGLKVQWNRHNTYLNNILLRSGNVAITGVWWGSNHYVARNIIDNGQCYWCNMYPQGSNIPDTIKLHTKMIDSNFITSSATQICGDQCYSWSTWRAAGLDVHTVLGQVTYADTTKVFPNYAPRGDFSITSPGALALGFKNFPMDSFGVMPPPPVANLAPFSVKNANTLENGRLKVNYNAGRLFVSHDGEYQLTLTTALGRTVKVFSGKGNSSFAINRKTTGSGIYVATVRSAAGVATRKFVVN